MAARSFGGVYVSDDLHRHVEGKIDISFGDLGNQSLKNIAAPVRLHRVRTRDAGLGDASAASAGRPLPDKPSIAAPPFVTMSGDAEQETFSDGITEDIIAELARFRSLYAIARNASFVFEGEAVDGSAVGRRFGVASVVEGGFRKVGGRAARAAALMTLEIPPARSHNSPHQATSGDKSEDGIEYGVEETQGDRNLRRHGDQLLRLRRTVVVRSFIPNGPLRRVGPADAGSDGRPSSPANYPWRERPCFGSWFSGPPPAAGSRNGTAIPKPVAEAEAAAPPPPFDYRRIGAH